MASSETSTKPVSERKFEKTAQMMENMAKMQIATNTTSSDEYMNEGPGRGLVYYLHNQKELRDDHPVWHYLYLCTLILVSFVALFIGPVIFGMLAAIGGIGTPFILSLLGSGIGLLFGLAFGVIFAVVCIVALVRAVGFAAEWVLKTLWFGGSDLLDTTKEKVLTLISDSP